MKFNLTAAAAAILALGLPAAHAEFKLGDNLTLSGFGTFGAAHSNDKTSDFTGNRFQPNGAGHNERTSFGPDSKLGGQVNAVFNDKFSAVVQVITQQQYDNSWTPQIEWANVKYQMTPELSVRLGRIASPTYLLSESRFVGYAMPWVRVPNEVYGVVPITSNDGVDATWRSQVAGANNTVQAYYGTSKVKLVGGGDVKSKPSYGINDTLGLGSLSLRAGYTSMNLDIEKAQLVPLFGAMARLKLTDLLSKYSRSDIQLSTLSLGASYDPGQWFVMGEFVDSKGQGLLSDNRAWYLSAGYRFGAWTPYATYSSLKPGIKEETGAGPLNAGINAILHNFNGEQSTKSFGVRWDAMKNVAVKAQYDRISTGAPSTGRLTAYPGFVPGSSINLVTVAVDFVF